EGRTTMTLYRTYRPSSFDDIVGNEDTIEAIQSCLAKRGQPHSYLIHGPAGCGKTTIGRIIATTLGCKGADFMELDSADFRGIDTVRSIRRQLPYLPLERLPGLATRRVSPVQQRCAERIIESAGGAPSPRLLHPLHYDA
ncbi:hypothetical protein LCGC14_2122240, partial [marine sediment metagenome]